MNRYMEAVVIGIAVAVVATIAGVGSLRASPNAQSIDHSGSAAPAVADTISVDSGLSEVAVRPGVSGRVVSVNIIRNQEVKKGDVLLRIDPLPYQSAFNKARRNLTAAQWQYERAVAERTRATYGPAASASTRDEIQLRIAAAEQASAAVRQRQAEFAQAKHDLESTDVTAPISGFVGRPSVAVGSVVKQGQTQLVRVIRDTSSSTVMMTSVGE